MRPNPGIGEKDEWDVVLELQGLTRRYGEVVALGDLSFTLAEGQMFGFVGFNGAGKTTATHISSSACWSLTPAKSDGSDP